MADEPTGNLNFEIGKQVVEQLLTVSKGKTFIAVTHDDRLAKYFDCVIDINQELIYSVSHDQTEGGTQKC